MKLSFRLSSLSVLLTQRSISEIQRCNEASGEFLHVCGDETKGGDFRESSQISRTVFGTLSPKFSIKHKTLLVLVTFISVLPKHINFFLNILDVKNIPYFEECSGTKSKICFVHAATLK